MSTFEISCYAGVLVFELELEGEKDDEKDEKGKKKEEKTTRYLGIRFKILFYIRVLVRLQCYNFYNMVCCTKLCHSMHPSVCRDEFRWVLFPFYPFHLS